MMKFKTDNGFAIVEEVKEAGRFPIADGWTAEKVTEYDSEGKPQRVYYRSRSPNAIEEIGRVPIDTPASIDDID